MTPSDSNWDNPYRPPDSHLFPAEELLWKRGDWGLWLSFLVLGITAVVGTILAFQEVRTIVASGLVLSLSGGLSVLLCFRRQLYRGLITGATGPLISIAVFLLINLLDWSPADAEKPVPLIAAGYTVILIGMLIVSGLELNARKPPMHGNPASQRLPDSVDIAPEEPKG